MPRYDNNTKHLKQYAAIVTQISAVEAELKRLKAQKADLDEVVADFFVRAGVNSTTIDGITIFRQRDFYPLKGYRSEDGRFIALGKDASEAEVSAYKQRLMQALKDSGLGEIVKEDVHAQTLAATVKEIVTSAIEDDPKLSPDAALPEKLRQVLSISEAWSIRTRKAPASKAA